VHGTTDPRVGVHALLESGGGDAETGHRVEALWVTQDTVGGEPEQKP
jgi:hypothetical protein